MNKAIRLKKWTIIVIVIMLIAVAIFLLFIKKPTQNKNNDSVQSEQSVLSVQVVSPKTQIWENTISATGPIAAWQEIIVSPEISGYKIAQLYVDVGDHVKKGQLLLKLADDSLNADLRKQQANLRQNQVSLQQAVSNLKRAKIIGAGGALSDQQLEEYRINVESAQASVASAQADVDSTQLKRSQTQIYAIDNGVVSSKSAVLGNVVSSGTELYRMIRQGRLEWRPEVDAKQIDSIQIGQKVNLSLSNGQQLNGVVRSIGPALSNSTGRSSLYVSLNSGNAHVGMFANGKISVGKSEANTIPQSALVMRDGRSYIYLVGQDQRVKSVVVETGRRVGQDVEILSALASNTHIVEKGGAFLSEGVKVKILSSENSVEHGSQPQVGAP
ncbi:efflux RND transporter periplasmic adaptor subunit [Acinetobacter calcoaceticus]|uniref:efflux RND transporter periplasmic adaptor subunit n=1 Tax=Acinetobacter calcoaceticus TaxID=471 RepID=UPI003AF58BA2